MPQEDLPAQSSSARVVHRHPSGGLLGGNSCVSHGCRRLCFVCVFVCVCVCVCVCVFVCVCVCVCVCEAA